MCAAGLRAFFNIGKVWGLDSGQEIILLGCPEKATYARWKKDPESAVPGRDVLERVSYILGIYKALQALFPEKSSADAWIRKPNGAAIFGGDSALDRMLAGNVSDLYVVRKYLDVTIYGGSR